MSKQVRYDRALNILNIRYGIEVVVFLADIAGGFLEIFGGSGTISHNSNFGVVQGESEVGCIVGRNNGGAISNNHYDKQMCGEK